MGFKVERNLRGLGAEEALQATLAGAIAAIAQSRSAAQADRGAAPAGALLRVEKKATVGANEAKQLALGRHRSAGRAAPHRGVPLGAHP